MGGTGATASASSVAELAALQRPAAAAAGDPLFLQVAGIPGDSTDVLHSKWIDVTKYSDSFAAGSALAGRPGAPKFGSLKVTMPDSTAVPPLLRALNTGMTLTAVELQAAVGSGDSERNYMTVKLTGAHAITLSESSSGGRPVDTLTLTAQKVSVSYTVLSTGTTTTTCYNYALNRLC